MDWGEFLNNASVTHHDAEFGASVRLEEPTALPRYAFWDLPINEDSAYRVFDTPRWMQQLLRERKAIQIEGAYFEQSDITQKAGRSKKGHSLIPHHDLRPNTTPGVRRTFHMYHQGDEPRGSTTAVMLPYMLADEAENLADYLRSLEPAQEIVVPVNGHFSSEEMAAFVKNGPSPDLVRRAKQGNPLAIFELFGKGELACLHQPSVDDFVPDLVGRVEQRGRYVLKESWHSPHRHLIMDNAFTTHLRLGDSSTPIYRSWGVWTDSH